MKLKLNKDYRIETDERNFILVKNNQNKYAGAIGYYSSLKQLFSGALFHGLKLTDLTKLKEIINHTNEFEANIKETLDKLPNIEKAK